MAELIGHDCLVPDDASAQKPLYQEVAEGIVADIQAGRLKPGDRIPPIRSLEGATSNSTARAAVRWLKERGWVRTGPGSRGSVVADPLPTTGPSLEERIAALEAWQRAHDARTQNGPHPEG